MATKKAKVSSPKSNPVKSGNPALRAEAVVEGPDPRSEGLSLWVRAFLLLTLVSSVALTLWATWGFKGTPTAAAFLISGMVSMLALSTAAFVLDRVIYRPGFVRSAKGRAQKAVIMVLVIAVGITILGHALDFFDPDSKLDQGNTAQQPNGGSGFTIKEDGTVVPVSP